MKRELSKEELHEIRQAGAQHGSDAQSGRTMDYWKGYGDGSESGYITGFMRSARQTVPLSAYTQAIQSLKSLRQHIESIPFADAVKMMEDSEAAGKVIEQSKTYLND